MENNNNLGMVWFNFFTKVRPILILAIFISNLGNALGSEISMFDYNYWGYFIYLNIISVILPVANLILLVGFLCMVEEKDGQYLMKYIKGLLIFECLATCYNQCLNQYYETIISNRAELNPPMMEEINDSDDDGDGNAEDTTTDSLNTDMLK